MSPVQCETLGSGLISCSCFLPPLKGRKERGLVVVWRMKQKGIAPYSWQESERASAYGFLIGADFRYFPDAFSAHTRTKSSNISLPGEKPFSIFIFRGKRAMTLEKKRGWKALCVLFYTPVVKSRTLSGSGSIRVTRLLGIPLHTFQVFPHTTTTPLPTFSLPLGEKPRWGGRTNHFSGMLSKTYVVFSPGKCINLWQIVDA